MRPKSDTLADASSAPSRGSKGVLGLAPGVCAGVGKLESEGDETSKGGKEGASSNEFPSSAPPRKNEPRVMEGLSFGQGGGIQRLL